MVLRQVGDVATTAEFQEILVERQRVLIMLESLVPAGQKEAPETGSRKRKMKIVP